MSRYSSVVRKHHPPLPEHGQTSIDRAVVRIQQTDLTTVEDMGASQSKPDGDKVFYNETPIQVRQWFFVPTCDKLTWSLAVLSTGN